MKKIFIYILSLLSLTKISSQVISYDTAFIPGIVKKNASVIKRNENILFEVTDIDKALLFIERAFTIMNDVDKEKLTFVEGTSKFVSLEDVDIKVYDAKGKLTTRFKKKDLTTVARGEGLIDDVKIHFIEIPATSYPVTVEFKYEMRFKGTLIYPRYDIIGPGEGVENSSFTAKVPKELDLRFREKNINIVPEIKEDGKYKLYRWSVKNLEPFEYEERSVSYENRYPSVILAPNKFKMDDYEGDMTTWKSFGLWYLELQKKQGNLTEERKAFFRDLVKDVSGDKQKIKLIYQYLQQNFRYVSIQLGIGGFKPLPADFTDNKKYGDCKGLSNYTQACLSAVGIKSYQVLIKREPRDQPLDNNFPYNSFNHVVVCVPLQKDTIWLECTSKTNDFGVLGVDNENKNALMITENGGVLVPTPISLPSSNTFSSTSLVILMEDGSGAANINLLGSGEYKDDLISQLLQEKKDGQKNYLYHYMGFKQPDEFEISKKENDRDLELSLKMEFEKLPEFTAGTKMFLNQRIYQIWSAKLPANDSRKLDFYFDNPFEKTDTTIFKLPGGYGVDVLPKEKQLKFEYGTYQTKHWFDEKQNSVITTARLILTQHRIPAARYAETKKFFDEVLDDNNQKLVIKKL